MHGLMLNLRLALRQLRRTPGFALTVVLTLALGIGATTAIFSLVEGVLLRPLPFHDPASLTSISDSLEALKAMIGDAGVTAPRSAHICMTPRASALSAHTPDAATSFPAAAIPQMVNAARMTAGVFPTLGVGPFIGRVFTQQEDDATQPSRCSVTRCGRAASTATSILGSKILLDRKPYEIIGVMPRNFEFPLVAGRLNQSELWVPMSFTPDELSPTSAANWGYNMVGRLKPGVTAEQATQDAGRVAQEVMRSFPPEFKQIHITAHVKSLKESAVDAGKPLVHILTYAVLVVLLIACLNVAGLLLVRAIRRRREHTIHPVASCASHRGRLPSATISTPWAFGLFRDASSARTTNRARRWSRW